MLNNGHLKQSRHRHKLDFHPDGKIKLTYSIDLQRQIRQLWLTRKHIPSSKIQFLADIYEQAFKNFLFETHIPKVLPKIKRQQIIVKGAAIIRQMLNDMEKIALKRQQPLSVIIEEAIQKFLDLPENYLGKDEYKPGKVEKIS